MSFISGTPLNASTASFRAAASQFFAQAKTAWNKMPRTVKVPVQFVAKHPFKLALATSFTSTALSNPELPHPDECPNHMALRTYGPLPENHTPVIFSGEAEQLPEDIKKEMRRIVLAANYRNANPITVKIHSVDPIFLNTDQMTPNMGIDENENLIINPLAFKILCKKQLEGPWKNTTPEELLTIIWHEIEHYNGHDLLCKYRFCGSEALFLHYMSNIQKDLTYFSTAALISLVRATSKKKFLHTIIKGVPVAAVISLAGMITGDPFTRYSLPETNRLHEKRCDAFEYQQASTKELEHQKKFFLTSTSSSILLTLFAAAHLDGFPDHPSMQSRITKIDAELERRKAAEILSQANKNN